ncbi:MAG TPA: DUF6390 family protein [Candidatus Nanoarchaeia archaeon]|nr:DUF6390 family protein [Candidatus Nanoarchaeia archaeon]
MDGIELAARFSYITNSLRYCGPEEASKQFLDYIGKNASAESVRESIKKFEGLYPYLSMIAQKAKMDFLDYDVVEAYWLGNSLLEKFEDDDMKEIVEKLMSRGLPKSIGTELIKNMPHGFVPHHNFNVFYVGVGRTTGAVETNLQNMDNCRVSWGKVVDILGNNLIIQSRPLKKENGILTVGDEETKTAVYIKDMLPSLKKNDYVALHWGFACLVLDDKQLENLIKYTGKILKVVNSRD